MRGIDIEMAEAEFHRDGISALVGVLTQIPRIDPEILRTLNYALRLAHDRCDVLSVMKELMR